MRRKTVWSLVIIAGLVVTVGALVREVVIAGVLKLCEVGFVNPGDIADSIYETSVRELLEVLDALLADYYCLNHCYPDKLEELWSDTTVSETLSETLDQALTRGGVGTVYFLNPPVMNKCKPDIWIVAPVTGKTVSNW